MIYYTVDVRGSASWLSDFGMRNPPKLCASLTPSTGSRAYANQAAHAPHLANVPEEPNFDGAAPTCPPDLLGRQGPEGHQESSNHSEVVQQDFACDLRVSIFSLMGAV